MARPLPPAAVYHRRVRASPVIALRGQRWAARFCACWLLLFISQSFATESSWAEPLYRLSSLEYRALAEERDALATEIAGLPATPLHQQSGRLGYQFFRYSPLTTPFEEWVEIDLGESSPVDGIVLVPVDSAYRDFPGPGYGFPLRFRVSVREGASEKIIADFSQRDFPNPGGLPVWLPAHGVSGRSVRVTMTKPWRHGDGVNLVALAEVMVMRGNYNLAAGLPSSAVSVSNTFESLRVWSKANLIDGQSSLGAPVGQIPSKTLGYHAAMTDRPDVVKWVQVDLGEAKAIDEVRLIGASVPQFSGRPGFGFPVRFKVEVADEPAFVSPRLLADETQRDFPNPGSNPVTIKGRGQRGRYVRLTATTLWERAENYALTLAEMQVYVQDVNVAYGQPVQFLDQYPATGRAWQAVNLTDGFNSVRRLVEWPAWLRGLSRRREVLARTGVLDEQLSAQQTLLAEKFQLVGSGLGMVVCFASLEVLRRARRSRQLEFERLRQRIASDLHDEIGSNLGTIALLSELALKHVDARAHDDVEQINQVARETADSMRDIVELVRRPATTVEEFSQRLRVIARRSLAGLEWTLTSEGEKPAPSLDVQRQLLLVFKEALHNIRKHARAQHVAIKLAQHDHALTLEITDDGIGFDAKVSTSGQGLSNLRQRAQTLGGSFKIESADGQGTKLVFTSPVHRLLNSG